MKHGPTDVTKIQKVIKWKHLIKQISATQHSLLVSVNASSRLMLQNFSVNSADHS